MQPQGVVSTGLHWSDFRLRYKVPAATCSDPDPLSAPNNPSFNLCAVILRNRWTSGAHVNKSLIVRILPVFALRVALYSKPSSRDISPWRSDRWTFSFMTPSCATQPKILLGFQFRPTSRPSSSGLYRVSQEERTKLRESVPYVTLYRYNPKHLYPKLNGYGDNGQRKVWTSCISAYCTSTAV